MMEGDGGSIVLATLARDGYLDAKVAFSLLNTTRWSSDTKRVDKVSAFLEEARADACIAKLGKQAGDESGAQRFTQRAEAIFAFWDQEHRVFKPEAANLARGDENRVDLLGQFTEGTPLQYSWAAEWQLDKLVRLHGGRDQFTCALDAFFYTAENPQGQKVDVTESGGMHGFTMGNELGLHVPYLYSLVGRPARTQVLVDKLVNEHFTSVASGLPGNDDLGALSAWLVWSMLGLYPADVCGDAVALGRPFVANAELRVRQGTLRIKVHDQSDENVYVERVQWNDRELDAGRQPLGGEPLTVPWSELHQGGLLTFWMTSEAPVSEAKCQDQQ